MDFSSTGPHQYWVLLKRRWLPASAVFTSILALAILSLVLQKPVYEAQGKLLFKKTDNATAATGSAKERGELDKLKPQGKPIESEIEVLSSTPVLQKTVAKLDLRDRNGTPLEINRFLKNLRVSNIQGSDVVQIAYRDEDAKLAAAIVNTLMAAYLENDVLTARTEAETARESIEQQLPQSEETMRRAELALRRFKEQNKIINLKEETSSAVAIIAEVEKQINTAQGELAYTGAQSTKLQSEMGMNLQKAVAVNSASQSPEVRELLREIRQVESQLASERSRFKEDSPTIAALKIKKAKLQNSLPELLKTGIGSLEKQSAANLQIGELQQKVSEELVQLEARRLGLTNQIAALTGVQNTYKQRLKFLPKLEERQRNLEQQLQVSQSNYALLQQRIQEIRIVENQNIERTHVMSTALIPETPISPNKGLYLIAGILLAIALSIATVLVLGAIDKSVKTVEEAKKLFGLTTLGAIPDLEKSERKALLGKEELIAPLVFSRDTPHSAAIDEAYNMLQVDLNFLNSDRKVKTIVVTSSVLNEGKSTVCANLSVALARLGHKVLLIDADLHKPSQHEIWGLRNKIGLTDVIADTSIRPTEIKMVMNNVTDNLDIITAGTPTSNSLALLSSKRMALLLEYFSKNYEFVFIDTPALTFATDASSLGKIADGVLFVVRPGVVDLNSVAFVKSALSNLGQNVLGQIVNGFIPENDPQVYSHFLKESHPDVGSVNTTHEEIA